jgi:hypothetical protein
MPDCPHPHVIITVEYAQHAHLITCASVTPAIVQVRPPEYGLGTPHQQGYWSRAHFYVKCCDCGYTTTFTSVDWRQFPKWLKRHWDNLVSASALPAEIQRHYRMFEEAPA